MRVLYVEDQKKLAVSVKKGLEMEGFAVDILHTGNEGLRRILGNSDLYDVIILDIMLPEISGIDILRKVREEKILTPILLLTALGEVDDRVAGLNTGADDYLPKPFAFAELLARVRALLRRPKESKSDTLTVRDISLDTNAHTIFKNGKPVTLTAKEFSLLEYLMRNPDRVLSRGEIMNHVWDFDFDSLSNVVDVHMKNIRKKLQKKNETIFETIHGVGYRCNAQDN